MPTNEQLEELIQKSLKEKNPNFICSYHRVVYKMEWSSVC